MTARQSSALRSVSSAWPLAVLVLLEDVLEIVAVDLEHDIRVHLDEAAIGIIGEALDRPRSSPASRPTASLRPRLSTVSIMPGIEARAPERTETQQRIGRVAERAPGLPPDRGDRGVDLRREIGRIGFAVGVEMGADFGRDREAGGHRQAERGHLVQVRALAAEQVLHLALAFGVLGAEGIDPFRHVMLPQSSTDDRAPVRPARAAPRRSSPSRPRETADRRRAACPAHRRCRCGQG